MQLDFREKKEGVYRMSLIDRGVVISVYESGDWRSRSTAKIALTGLVRGDLKSRGVNFNCPSMDKFLLGFSDNVLLENTND